jgi:hypothetical protein
LCSPDAFLPSDWPAAGAILQNALCLLCRSLHLGIDGRHLFPFLRSICIDMGFTLLHICHRYVADCLSLLGSHLSQSNNSWQELFHMLEGSVPYTYMIYQKIGYKGIYAFSVFSYNKEFLNLIVLLFHYTRIFAGPSHD